MANKFLYAEIYEEVLNSITKGEFPSGELLPSEKELCKMFDTSLITVRRALFELEHNGIIVKLKGKGSQVNMNIRHAHKELNKNIGVLDIPNPTQIAGKYPAVPFDSYLYNKNEWKNLIYSSIYKELFPNYNMILGSYTKEAIISKFENTVFFNTDRIIIFGLYDREIIDFLNSKGKLVLIYNNFDENIKACNVSSNERINCCKATERLISMGHRKIAAINGDITFSESIERSMGYQEALMKNSISVDSSMIKWGNMTAESGYHLAKELLEQGTLPTAIVCVNDNVAAGALIAIKENGLNCPQDISVIGHDNNELIYPITTPELSSIDPHYVEVGMEIAKKIIREVWVDDNTIIDCDIIFRQSINQIKKNNRGHN